MRRPPMDLTGFLVNAPKLFSEEATTEEEIDPDIAKGKHGGAIRRFDFDNGDKLSCIRWDTRFHITSTDIIKALVHRFKDIRRPVVNMKKFEEGVFSDLRSLKPGVDARLEMPRSEFLELLHKHHCVRTQKKQKVFYWESVPHDLLFREALERDLKREAMGVDPTTKTDSSVDPSSVVVIGGIELPLSVPPTLAVHPCAAMEAAGNCATTTSPSVRVPNAQISSVTCPKAPVQAASLVDSKKSVNGATAMSVGVSQGDKKFGSSMLSLTSLVSSNHGDENEGNSAHYPDSSSMYAEPIDILHISPVTCSSVASMPNSAPAVVVANENFSSQQMRQYINQHQHQQAAGFSNPEYPGIGFLSSGASQPSLSEYISGKTASVASSNNDGYSGQDIAIGTSASSLDVAPINGSWTGMDVQQLHKKASELRANYNEYQPTPTPHHSPKCGAANGQELSDLLSSDPNALVTEDNIGDFNALLEKLLGGSNNMQESMPSQSAAQAGSSDHEGANNDLLSAFSDIQYEQQQQQLLSQSQSQSQSQPQSKAQQAYLQNIFGSGALSGINVGQIPSRSMSGICMDVDMGSAANSSGRAPSSAATGMMDSINSSPMVASIMNSQRITPNQTPDVTNAMQFDNANALRADSSGNRNEFIESMQPLSAGELGSAVFGQQTANSKLSAALQLSPDSIGDNMNNAAPRNVTDGGYGSVSQEHRASNAFAASLAEARNSMGENAKSLEILKNLWFGNQPSNVPTPRSTRFSRFHPYLKTMARIAHRESPTLVNRVLTTTNPTVAAAAVNVIAAKLNRDQQTTAMASSSGSVSVSTFPFVPGSSTVVADASGINAEPGVLGSNASNAGSSAQVSSSSVLDMAAANATNGHSSYSMPTNASLASEPAATNSKSTASTSSSARPPKRSAANDGASANDEEQPRRYICEYAGCNKQFKRHEHLKRHFRVHTGERPYKCPAPDCDKVFARMDNLNQHIRTHVNRKTANRRTSGAGGAVMANSENMALNAAALQNPKEALGGAARASGAVDAKSILDGSDSFASQPAPATAPAPAPAPAPASASPYMFSGTNGRMSLFNQGVARAVESLGASSGISAIPLSSGMAPLPNASNGAMGEGSSDVLTAQQLHALSQERAMDADNPMRAELQDDFSLSSREWLIGGGNGQYQYQHMQPMQSPSIENNAVTMLRKLTKNNRLRNTGFSPLAAPNRPRDRLESPFSPDAILSLGASPSVLPMSGMFGGIDVNGFAFSQEARLLRQDSSGAGRSAALSSERGAASIAPGWIDSFFSQQQQSLNMAGGEAVSAQPVGFGAQWARPGTYQEVHRRAANSNGDAVRQPRSLKRYHEDGYDGEDVTMIGDGVHRSLSTSGDEMSAGSIGASDAHVNKLVRSGVVSNPHVHKV